MRGGRVGTGGKGKWRGIRGSVTDVPFKTLVHDFWRRFGDPGPVGSLVTCEEAEKSLKSACDNVRALRG